MKTLIYLELSLVILVGACWIVSCLVSLCNAGREKTQTGIIESSRKTFNANIVENGKVKPVVMSFISKSELANALEADNWKKETKITLAPSRRLCEDAVKHLN